MRVPSTVLLAVALLAPMAASDPGLPLNALPNGGFDAEGSRGWSIYGQACRHALVSGAEGTANALALLEGTCIAKARAGNGFDHRAVVRFSAKQEPSTSDGMNVLRLQFGSNPNLGQTGAEVEFFFTAAQVAFSVFGGPQATVDLPADGQWHTYTLLFQRNSVGATLLVDDEPRAVAFGTGLLSSVTDGWYLFLLRGAPHRFEPPGPPIAFDEIYVGPTTL